jgi:hypothetical protein
MVMNRCNGLRDAGCFLANAAMTISPKTLTNNVPILGNICQDAMPPSPGDSQLLAVAVRWT